MGNTIKQLNSENPVSSLCHSVHERTIRIMKVDTDFERELLIRPFGFKGGYISELWQSVVRLESESGIRKTGLGTNSILWSDASVFSAHSESAGNALMFAVTEYALQMIKGRQFTNPIQLLDGILEDVHTYGKKITCNPDLRKTFTLNALVALDNAAWLLYAAENKMSNFDEMIPATYKQALSYRHDRIAGIPLIAYNVPVSEIEGMTKSGYFFMKIKLGQPGSQQEMLEKDIARLTLIHQTIGEHFTSHTDTGKLLYYFDANGRYENKETLQRFLDHAKKIGAFEQIAMIEEPFPENYKIDVHDIDVRLTADESAHTDIDVLERIQMGYKAIALKPIAKTMSMTMKIAKVAHEYNIPCFCADLTVNPILVEWNKNVAARLAPFPGLTTGLLETNGDQNYKNWEVMQTYNPVNQKEWTKNSNGVYFLNKSYYQNGGGIFYESPHYEKLFSHQM